MSRLAIRPGYIQQHSPTASIDTEKALLDVVTLAARRAMVGTALPRGSAKAERDPANGVNPGAAARPAVPPEQRVPISAGSRASLARLGRHEVTGSAPVRSTEKPQRNAQLPE